MSRRHVVAAVSGALGVLLALALLLGRDSDPPEVRSSDRGSPEATPSVERKPGAAPEQLDPEHALENEPLPSGGTLTVSRDSLAAVGSLVVPLQLGQPEAPGSVLSGRIVTEGRVLEVSAAVGEEAPDVAEIDVAADFLRSPGRYIVEIKTSEKSHFPLRRYAIEVR